MRKRLLIFLIGFIPTALTCASQTSSFEVVMQHYEPIRLALIEDSTEGVAQHGEAIASELKALQENFTVSRVGASNEAASVVKEKLPGMIISAQALAQAESLETVRSAFYELSKPMVRWREGVAQEGLPSVAYCSMHKKSWLQPGQQIGNPYGGMPRCGQIVSK